MEDTHAGECVCMDVCRPVCLCADMWMDASDENNCEDEYQREPLIGDVVLWWYWWVKRWTMAYEGRCCPAWVMARQIY